MDLSRHHPIDAADLKQEIDEVARYRGARLAPLAEVLEGYADSAEGAWSGWHRRSNADHLPEQFTEVLAAVIEFADPILLGSEDVTVWTPGVGAWR